MSLKPIQLALLLSLLAALITSLFIPSLSAIIEKWNRFDDIYAHGYLVLACFIYFVYQDLNCSQTKQTKNRLGLYIGLILSLAVALTAQLSFTLIISQVLIPLIILLTIACLFGWNKLIQALPYCSLLLLAAPIWDLIIPALQALTVFVCENILNLLSIPISIHSTYIKTTVGIFHVAEGCSGIAYFLTTISFALIYSIEYKQTSKQRILILLIAIFVGLFSNWIRVLSLVLIGIEFGIDYPIIKDHSWHGWLINGCTLLLMLFTFTKLFPAPTKKPVSTQVRPHVLKHHILIIGTLYLSLLALISIAPMTTQTQTASNTQPAASLQQLYQQQGWNLVNSNKVNISTQQVLSSFVYFNGYQRLYLDIIYFSAQNQGIEAAGYQFSGNSLNNHNSFYLLGDKTYQNQVKVLLAIAWRNLWGDSSAYKINLRLDCPSKGCSFDEQQQLLKLSHESQGVIQPY